jgi:RNA polymerase sigma-70 factor (ECF subfamily)
MNVFIEKEQRDCQSEPDRLLVEKASQGDQAAFETLVQRYHSSLLAYIKKRTTYDALAEDILQFVWLQLYLSLSQISQYLSSERSAGSLRTWLFHVAVNRCIDEHRRKHELSFSELSPHVFKAGEPSVELLLEEQLIDSAPPPEEEIERRERQKRLRTAIETLPERFRAVVLLRYTEGVTYKEIGNRLHMPGNTAKTYFQRALPLLRTALAEYP